MAPLDVFSGMLGAFFLCVFSLLHFYYHDYMYSYLNILYNKFANVFFVDIFVYNGKEKRDNETIYISSCDLYFIEILAYSFLRHTHTIYILLDISTYYNDFYFRIVEWLSKYQGLHIQKQIEENGQARLEG